MSLFKTKKSAYEIGSQFFLNVILIFASACSTTKESLKSNPNLIRPYRYSDEQKEPFEAPYIAKYKKKNKELWYLAADHTDDFGSATFKTVRDAFSQLKPQAVIIEGVEYTGVFSPEDHSHYVRMSAQNNFKGSSESSYAAWLALERGAPFVPGEPEDKAIAVELEKRGYKKIEYYYFDLARVVPQWRRTKKVTNLKQFKERAPKFMSSYFENFDPHKGFDFSDFERWYVEKSEKKFDFSKIDNEDFSPQIDHNPKLFNKMAHDVGMIRERHVLGLIEMLLNRFDRVLVVFGSGHLVKERDALADLLGPPKDEKLF